VKIRTLEELETALDGEFAWRRRELSVIGGQIAGAKGPAVQMLLRAGIALLYAHFEGFVKGACEAYVEYVARQRVDFEVLAPGLRALALRGQLSSTTDAKTMRVWVPFVESLEEARGKPMDLPKTGAVRTRSNLSANVLLDILMSIGVDFGPYELKRNLIDKELVDRRNRIAHGRQEGATVEEFADLLQQVSGMMTTLRGQISNAAQMAEYRVPP
jgi:hypothetical protein